MSQRLDVGDSDEDGVPAGIATEVAHNARVWDYWLGGTNNFLADRTVGDQILQMFPVIADVARADRGFLIRVVRYLVGGMGIRQFLDIGTGLPTANNIHEVAQAIAPESRIVYADNDPLVLAHARALLTSTPQGATDYLNADAHHPGEVLAGASRTLDFTEPVAVMMLGVLNFVADTDEAHAIVHGLMNSMSAGSCLAVTHPTLELGGEVNVEAMAFWNEHATPPIRARTGEEIARFFDRLELLEPGLVSCSQWRPDPDETGAVPAQVPQYGAVGTNT